MTEGEVAAEGAGAWDRLRAFTPARIGLARAGVAVATAPLLDFRAAHAAARDAVAVALDVGALERALAPLGLPVVRVASEAADRREYLMRPDLGRTLAPSGRDALAPHRGAYDLAVVVADGLSALAAQRHAAPVLEKLRPALGPSWRWAPLVTAVQGRVALGDDVARALGAGCVVTLIGERPGLTAPDSLGAYVTWAPRPGVTDADRNCVSNIRPDGAPYDEAARQIAWLLTAARGAGYSGVALKNRADDALPAPQA